MRNGVIRFYKEDGISRLYDFEFYDAHCINYRETFNSSNSLPMITALTISAGIIRVRDMLMEKKWKVSDLSSMALNFPDAEKTRDIVNLQWKRDYSIISEGYVLEKVFLTADVVNITDGQSITFDVIEKTMEGENKQLARVRGSVIDGRIEIEWTVAYNYIPPSDNDDDKEVPPDYVVPEVYFSTIYKGENKDSPIMKIKAFIDLLIINDYNNEPFTNTNFELLKPDGQKEIIQTDEAGRFYCLEPGFGRYVFNPIVIENPETNLIHNSSFESDNITSNPGTNYEYTIPQDKKKVVTGSVHNEIKILPLRCIVDGHIHIMNGKCTPLPLLRHRAMDFDFSKKTLDTITNKLFKSFSEFSSSFSSKLKESTNVMNYLNPLTYWYAGAKAFWETVVEDSALGKLLSSSIPDIGKQVINQSEDSIIVYEKSKIYERCKICTLLVTLMMDMEYAHLDGYEGKRIYQVDTQNNSMFYLKRKSGKNNADSEKDYVRKPLDASGMVFSDWTTQLVETKTAMVNNPLRLFGMCHYDPRRFKGDNWEYPFTHVISGSMSGIFSGFKMYPALGYKPLDKRLPNLRRFYQKCEKDGIPIIVHSSNGGFWTHDFGFYLEYDQGAGDYSYYYEPDFVEGGQVGWYKIGNDGKIVSVGNAHLKRLKKDEYEYFWDNYCHPKQWKEVLKDYPKLKLCLAHFGGEAWDNKSERDWIETIISLTKYENVYTDISCWDLPNKKRQKLFREALVLGKNSHLKNKIIYGTDWYMPMISVGTGKNYRESAQRYWNFFQEMKNGDKVWQRFTFINPFEFFGFNDMKKIEWVRNRCIYWGGNIDQIDIQYEKLRILNEDVYPILKENLKSFEI
jgi:predicted TIM-barrel fold metal-dependent hydrolase